LEGYLAEIAEQINVGNAGRRHAQRSSIRYTFLTPIRMVNVSGKRIWGLTSNISNCGCRVTVATTFIPATQLKLTIEHQGTIFQSDATVVYTVANQAMGMRFHDVRDRERTIIEQWIVELTRRESQQGAQSTRTDHSAGKRNVVVAGSVISLASVAGALAWFRSLR
jgi:hypothetical protein